MVDVGAVVVVVVSADVVVLAVVAVVSADVVIPAVAVVSSVIAFSARLWLPAMIRGCGRKGKPEAKSEVNWEKRSSS